MLEKTLYDPLCTIINAVISYFGLENRETGITSQTYIQHQNSDDKPQPSVETMCDSQLASLQYESNETFKFRPDITIFAKGGPSFELDKYPDSTTSNRRSLYKGCATPLEVKMDSNNQHRQFMLQVGIYARFVPLTLRLRYN